MADQISRIFKTAWFSKAARKARIKDDELREAIQEAMKGQADDLGGGVFKKRLNKNMYRSIILAKGGRYWIYQYLLLKKIGRTLTMVSWRTSESSRRAMLRWTSCKWLNCWPTKIWWRYLMAKKNKFKSDISEAIHSSAAMLHKVGALDKATMRDFDARHLKVASKLEPAQIKRLREANNVSQPVFARYLNTSESTVEKWETGAKRPSGMALKLLTIVQKHGLKILG
jgi:putative transcriptional regulator